MEVINTIPKKCYRFHFYTKGVILGLGNFLIKSHFYHKRTMASEKVKSLVFLIQFQLPAGTFSIESQQ